ncbi:MAG: UDP-N-acetylmuramate dehydrogenase [Chromatiales bacterium]|nr:UDP-N-acetylmuramate dehydrogenase [Chromatiales bacterium]
MAAFDQTVLRGEMRYDEPLARHTTWRVGGPADRFYAPADSQDLITFLQQLSADEPLFWLGLGSNLLVRDGGFRGTVVALRGCLEEMALVDDVTLRVEAGASCAKVARFAARNGLCGAEFLAGIPGTIGGALAMNAGAFGGETWERVSKVETIDQQGQVFTRTPEQFEIGYRHVKGEPGEWFLAAYLQLEPGDVDAGQAKIRQLLNRRSETQPTGLPSCGSVFRNPPGDHAARLIEQAGLKNTCIGGACVSEKHANFIINSGNAKAAEIEALIKLVQQRVQEMSGIELRTEVRVIGEESGQ